MKPVTRLFAVAVLAASTWWCMKPVPVVQAQGQCANFDRQYENPCDSCCLGGTDESDVTDGFTNGPGMETLQSNSLDCGTSGDCIGGNAFCRNFGYLQALDDPNCCLTSGTPCNQGTCCSGLICLLSNTCGVCIQDGSYCSSSADCCSEFCNTDSNTCGYVCGLSDSICSIDSDCCSYACIDGYCE